MKNNAENNCNGSIGIVLEYDLAEEIAVPHLLVTKDENIIAEKLTDRERELLARCEQDIEDNQEGFYAFVGSLAQINHLRLYRETHTSFEAYVREKWDITGSHAYRLIAAKQTADNLKASPIGEGLEFKESQLRPLAGLPAQKQVEVVAEAQAQTGEKNPPAKAIAEAKRKVVPQLPKSTRTKATKAEKREPKADVQPRLESKMPFDLISVHLKEVKELMKAEGIDRKKILLEVGYIEKLVAELQDSIVAASNN